MSSNPVSGPLPCCGQLALVNECNRDVSLIDQTAARCACHSRKGCRLCLLSAKST